MLYPILTESRLLSDLEVGMGFARKLRQWQWL